VTVESVALALTQAGPYVRGLPLNVVVGGRTSDGERYVTYRFTGSETREGESPREACDALERAYPPRTATSVAAQGKGAPAEANDSSSWRSGRLCTAQGCAD
jgi:hypothetical protein